MTKKERGGLAPDHGNGPARVMTVSSERLV